MTELPFVELPPKKKMAAPARVGCPCCGRDYVSPLDLPPIVITAVETIEGGSQPAWKTEFTDYTARTRDMVQRQVDQKDAKAVRRLIQETTSGTDTLSITLWNGKPGTVTVTDGRPQSLDYSIVVAEDVCRLYAAKITLVREKPLFQASAEPVRVRELWRAPGLSPGPTQGDASLQRAWLTDGSAALAIGWLNLRKPDESGTFELAIQKRDDVDVWNTITRLWRVHFHLAQ